MIALRFNTRLCTKRLFPLPLILHRVRALRLQSRRKSEKDTSIQPTQNNRCDFMLFLYKFSPTQEGRFFILDVTADEQ